MAGAHDLSVRADRGVLMDEKNHFQILIYPENGEGVINHALKFIESSPDGLNLEAKQIRTLILQSTFLQMGMLTWFQSLQNGGSKIGDLNFPHH